MADPLVSVIVPVHDGERFLAQALESIFRQRYRSLDVIVVDDGSEDTTAVIARSFPDVRYLYHFHRGLAGTRNAGVAASRGELISFLDSDDLWIPDKLAIQVAHLTSSPDTDYVVARLRNFLEPGYPRPSWLKREQLEEDQLAFSTGTLLARRTVFDRIGVFDTRFTSGIGDDTDWFARANSLGLVAAVLPNVVLLRRIHDRNVTGQTAERALPTALSILKASLDRRRRGATGSPPGGPDAP